jgi:hypothetical protein
MTDKSDLDDIAFMDTLQKEVEESVNETIPFEPDRELQEQTGHEEPVEFSAGWETDDVEADDVTEPLADLELDDLEGE